MASRARKRPAHKPGDRRASKTARKSAPPASPRLRKPATPHLLFAMCLCFYLLNGDFLYGNDQSGNMLVSANLIKHQSLTISPYQAPRLFGWHTHPGADARPWSDEIRADFEQGLVTPTAPLYYLVETRRPDEFVSVFGIGAPLTALPVYALVSLFTDVSADGFWWWYTPKLAASLLTALTVVLLFLTMRRFVSEPAAAAAALAFGVGTSAWTISSQALWQHTPFSFFLALGIWLWLGAEERRYSPYLCGAAFGMAVLCRPTGVLLAACVGVYLLITNRPYLLKYVLGGLPFAAVLMIYNHYYFGNPFTVGQQIAGVTLAEGKGKSGAWQMDFARSVPGLLVSPSRGLLVYSPVLLFAIAGAVTAWKSRRTFAALIPLQAAFLLHFLVAAMWYDWWGGWTFGPRTLLDTGVLLVLLMIPVLPRVTARPALRALFAVLLLYSAAVQFTGAWSYNARSWNFRNNADIDHAEHRHRLWSIGDSQIVYYLTHFGEGRAKKQRQMRSYVRTVDKNPVLMDLRQPE